MRFFEERKVPCFSLLHSILLEGAASRGAVQYFSSPSQAAAEAAAEAQAAARAHSAALARAAEGKERREGNR